ncbi:Aldo/keto reductase [Punctularia strigosozonata HHB-11173 SS5]|uniref:Aldo/keto reductase n=1 Tax=Punctularia strigosozonata (strain HHB-11173) TaxID=741275 RepID=UPI00044185BF|nr:Aldo/keto reductase [Punctularia strigosozonata HHB-11173 SS5]EIN11408.1 Aldo/keto reductase [Punctularia strigosozonata HHB-11173 SS5]
MASSTLSLVKTLKLSSGYQIPVLGLGVALADDCVATCLAALKHGYRHIDSARHYGNEAQVGEAVRQSGIPREEVFITSKVFDQDHGYESTKKAVQGSLDDFAFDYIDLYLIHSPRSGKERRLETYKALLDLKKEGKIRTAGVSNYGVKHLEEIKNTGLELPSVNQIELHPFCQQRPIVEYCKKHGIVVEAYAPLVRAKRMDHPVLVELSRKYETSPAQILVRWGLQHELVELPKSSQPQRLVANADVFDFNIEKEDLARLDALDMGPEGAVAWNPVGTD